ncbi:unnamed protein product [Calypogeia fissa]
MVLSCLVQSVAAISNLLFAINLSFTARPQQRSAAELYFFPPLTHDALFGVSIARPPAHSPHAFGSELDLEVSTGFLIPVLSLLPPAFGGVFGVLGPPSADDSCDWLCGARAETCISYGALCSLWVFGARPSLPGASSPSPAPPPYTGALPPHPSHPPLPV